MFITKGFFSVSAALTNLVVALGALLSAIVAVHLVKL